MRRLARLYCLPLLAVLISPAFAQIDPAADHLPDTAPLELNEPLDVVMVRGINYFAERELADSPNRRAEKWNRDYSSVEAYEASVAENRERLRTIIGAVDDRVFPVRLSQSFGLDYPGFESAFLLNPGFVTWGVLDGVTAEGIRLPPPLVIPDVLTPDLLKQGVLPDRDELLEALESSSFPTEPIAIVVPDPAWSPELLAGLSEQSTPELAIARRLAESGCQVYIPTVIDRTDRFSGHPDIRYTNIPHREFVYRMAFEMGRHIIGYEVQKVLAAIDHIRTEMPVRRSAPIVVVGIGEGGLIALQSAALDTRIDACLVSGYFGERENVWQEPIYRNVWTQLTEFGDADLASLIAPRHLIVEAGPAPEIDGPPAADQGHSNSAAPGRISTPNVDSVEREFARAKQHYERLGVEDRIQLALGGAEHTGHDAALEALLKSIGIDELKAAETGGYQPPYSFEHDAPERPDYTEVRQQRQFNELVRYTQRLMHSSDKQRAKFWNNADRSSVDAWVESAEWYRNYVHEEMIGKLSEPTMPPNPRSRKVIDEPTHVGYEVVLDCYPAGDEERPIPDGADTSIPDTGSVDNIGWAVGQDWGVIAGGILLLPTDLKAGERRPVVVCQHGLEGTPMATITTDDTTREWRAYKGFSTELVKRGFIVYAPQNPYRGHDAFRVIQRKSNPMGRSLYSYIIEQHRRTLDWLASLPYVDPERIGFYGLSYGGKTAVRVPPMLPPTDNHPGYCLSICSADFNEWVIKNVSSEDRYSYIFTGEYEMFEWNLGHVANYGELCSLMTPRPFMVERGHDDGVAPDEWVAWEYAKVRRHYDQLGIGDRTEIEFFNGPHTINGQGTFAFLHRHLNWPAP